MLPIVMDALALLREIPYSTIFILSVATGISLLTTLANRLLSNPEKAKAVRKEVGEWNKELREAQRNKDKKTVEKLMKKQQYMMQLQSKMMWQSMKVSLLFLVPLLLMWQLLGRVYGRCTNSDFPRSRSCSSSPLLQRLSYLVVSAGFTSFWYYFLTRFWDNRGE